MKIKKIIIIFTFFLLSNCGYEPMYSKKNLQNSYNFTISSIGFSGENIINQTIKNNLSNYINIETKQIKYDLIIDSKFLKTITSKNKKGDPEIFYIKIIINLDVLEANNIINKTVFDGGFEYKNKSNKFELRQYEESIQKNLSYKISEEIIEYLNSIK